VLWIRSRIRKDPNLYAGSGSRAGSEKLVKKTCFYILKILKFYLLEVGTYLMTLKIVEKRTSGSKIEFHKGLGFDLKKIQTI